MNKRLAAVLAVVALLAGSCGSSGSDGSEDAGETGTSTTASSTTASTPPSDSIEDESEPQSTIEPGDSSTFFPDVVAADASQADDGTWTFSVTLSSPYDSPEQYADAWRVVGSDGTEFGFRLLTHDHASEQPFTRSQSGIEIPEGVTTVTIEGRDQANGWGGTFLDFELPA